MYLMYVDESGDVGLENSPTKTFILTAIVVHERRWNHVLQDLVRFRRQLKESKGLKIREEIHAVHFINKPGELIRIKRNDRLDILKKCIDWLAVHPDVQIFSVVVDKSHQTGEVFEYAWNVLLNRFERTLAARNFRGSTNAEDCGMIISDNTEGEKLRKLVRRMRHYNPVPNQRSYFPGGSRNQPLRLVIEDPAFRDSANSLLHQMNDVAAYFCRQMFESNAYVKKKGGVNFYRRLGGALVTQVSASNDGIVRL